MNSVFEAQNPCLPKEFRGCPTLGGMCNLPPMEMGGWQIHTSLDIFCREKVAEPREEMQCS
jgi:hypothetical protein